MGKTFLIREFFKDYIEFAFTGTFETETNIQLENFFREYIRRTNGKKESNPPKNWNEAFSYLTDYLNDFKNRKKKIVVFIDEMFGKKLKVKAVLKLGAVVLTKIFV